MNWGNAHIGTVNGIMLYALYESTKYNPVLQWKIGEIQRGYLVNAVKCDYNSRQIVGGILIDRGGMWVDGETVRDIFIEEWRRK